jgi:hypothetical protein
MKAQVLFDTHGHVISMLIPATRAGHVPATLPRAVFRLAGGQRSAELEIPVELRELRLLDIHAAVLVDLKGAEPHLVKNPDAPTLPLPPPRRG